MTLKITVLAVTTAFAAMAVSAQAVEGGPPGAAGAPPPPPAANAPPPPADPGPPPGAQGQGGPPPGPQQGGPPPAAQGGPPPPPPSARRGTASRKPPGYQSRTYSGGQGATWKTGRNSYGFQGSYGGCQYVGGAGPGGYRINKVCR